MNETIARVNASAPLTEWVAGYAFGVMHAKGFMPCKVVFGEMREDYDRLGYKNAWGAFERSIEIIDGVLPSGEIHFFNRDGDCVVLYALFNQ